MMRKMLRFTKITFWVVIIAFVGFMVFNVGMKVTSTKRRSSMVVGEVNGIKISYQQFQNTLRRQYMENRDKVKEMDSQAEERLREETWNNIVNYALLDQEVKKRGIKVSNSEVIAWVASNPPPSVLSDTTFRTEDGKFDYQRYMKLLSNPYIDWSSLEEKARSLLPVQKLQNLVFNTVRVTANEVEQEYIRRNEKVKVRWLQVLPSDFHKEKIQVSDEEAQTYYQEHKEDFQEPPKTNLKYLLLAKEPSKADEESVRVKIEEIRDMVISGEDFSDLAQEYSQGPSAAKGGDLGFFERGSMVKPFEDAAFSLKQGEISQPVRTRFGWHIIKVEERGEDKVHARHILLKVEPSLQTLDEIRNRAEDFAHLAAKERLVKAADDSLQLKETGLFNQGRYIPMIGVNPTISKFVEENDVGKTSSLVETKAGYYIFQIVEKKGAEVPPLSAVKERIKSQLSQQKRRELALREAKSIAQRAKEKGSLIKTAREYKLKTKPTDYFTRMDYIPDVGRLPRFIGTAFRLKKGEISPVVETEKGFYILQLLSKKGIDEKGFAEEKDDLRKEILQAKRKEAFTKWFTAIRDKAVIKDYRNQFYK